MNLNFKITNYNDFLNLFGLITSILVLSIAFIVPYGYITKCKAFIIGITSLIIYLTTSKLISPIYFNKLMTLLIMINIIGLILLKSPPVIILFVILICITTPIFKFNNNKIITKSNVLNKNIWMFFYTVVLLYIFINNKNFNCSKCTQDIIINYLVIIALIIPYFIYIYNSNWLEWRLLSLNIVVLSDYFLYLFN